MNKLKKYKLSDLYTMSSGLSSTKEQARHGMPFISFSTIFNNYFLPDKIDDLMSVSDKELESYSVKKGDVFLTRTSETVDELAMSCVSLKEYDNTTFSGFAKRLRPKKDGIVYEKYIAFYLRSPYFRQVIKNNTIMTLRASFNEDIFSFIEIYLPEYKEQIRIGDLLYSIEKKINNNKSINDNLYEQMMLVFNYWFIQFNFPDKNKKPYKANGGKMIFNENIGQFIPDNWTIKPINQLVDLVSGFSFSSTYYEKDGKYPLITIKNVQDNGINLNVDNYLNFVPENMPDYCLLKQSDILMSLTGNVGRVGLMYIDNCFLNQRVALINPLNKNLKPYIFNLFKSNFLKKRMETIANGSSQKNLSPVEVGCFEIPFNQEIQEIFSNKFSNHIATITRNLNENHKLIKLRDWLLPMLMNGQATIE